MKVIRGLLLQLDDNELLRKVKRGTLGAEAQALAIEELNYRGIAIPPRQRGTEFNGGNTI